MAGWHLKRINWLDGWLPMLRGLTWLAEIWLFFGPARLTLENTASHHPYLQHTKTSSSTQLMSRSLLRYFYSQYKNARSGQYFAAFQLADFNQISLWSIVSNFQLQIFRNTFLRGISATSPNEFLAWKFSWPQLTIQPVDRYWKLLDSYHSAL